MQKILVIDDDETLRSSIAYALRKNNFTVIEAQSGKDGFQLARNRLPDLILCDLNLEETNGTELLKALRENPATEKIPFVLMTGEGVGNFSGSEKLAYEVLQKPFTVPVLLAAMRNILKSGTNRAGAAAQSATKSQKVPKIFSSENPSALTSREQFEALTVRLRSVQEEERSRLARTIHDELIQDLTVLAIELSLLRSTLNENPRTIPVEECRTSIAGLSTLVDGLIKSAQRITADLRPKVLDEFGLAAALEWLAQQFETRTGINFKLDIAELSNLDSGFATEVYRVAQQIISNATQHSGASLVAICVKENGRFLFLEIKDNGKGITERQIKDVESLGLLAMRDQIERFGGKFSINGVAGKGTTVTLEIPLRKKPGGRQL